MFRRVTTAENQPAYFLLCDHPQCMDARRGTAAVANREEALLSKKLFLKSAIEEGWFIDLEGSYCPAHARDLLHAARETEERAKQVVAPARPQDVLAFGKARP